MKLKTRTNQPVEGDELDSLKVNGDLDVTGDISGNNIVENMNGYSFTKSNADLWNDIYVGVCKNGNKLTFVIFGSYKRLSGQDGYMYLGTFNIPSDVRAKLYPYEISGFGTILENKPMVFNQIDGLDTFVSCQLLVQKESDDITFQARQLLSLTNDKTYYFRAEVTFLLSDNLVANE